MWWLLTCAVLTIPLYMAALAVSQRNLYTALIERITMSTAETQAAIDNVVAQLTKSHQELSAELAKATADIGNQLADAGVEVDLSALTEISQKLDDLVPDAAVTAPAEVTEEVDTLEAEVDPEVDTLEAVETVDPFEPVDKATDKRNKFDR